MIAPQASLKAPDTPPTILLTNCEYVVFCVVLCVARCIPANPDTYYFQAAQVALFAYNKDPTFAVANRWLVQGASL
jgi:hypothetical protein